nr:MAG TPA: hypothetical protein [Caudoviricetes sp.]
MTGNIGNSLFLIVSSSDLCCRLVADVAGLMDFHYIPTFTPHQAGIASSSGSCTISRPLFMRRLTC